VRLGLLDDERGASLVEYLVLVGCVAVLALAGVRALGTATDGKASAQAECVATFGCGAPGSAAEGDYTLMTADMSKALGDDAAALQQVPMPTGEPPPGAPGSDDGTSSDGATSSALDAAAGAALGAAQGTGEHLADVVGGFFVDGLVGDLQGVYELVTDPVGTAAGLWTLVRMANQGLPLSPMMTPNPLYDAEQARALEALLTELGAQVVDHAWNEPDRAVGRAGYELVTFVVAPAKVLKALKLGKLKALTRFPRVGKASKLVSYAADSIVIASFAAGR
jgi:Flp pilus assembly pilin Flp